MKWISFQMNIYIALVVFIINESIPNAFCQDEGDLAEEKDKSDLLDKDETLVEDFLESSSDSKQEEEKAVSIAEHIRRVPNILTSFKPSALRNVVNNPKSLAILPMKVLDKLISDPIFSISVPPNIQEKISDLFQERFMEAPKTEDDNEIVDDYDYYDLDLGDEEIENTVSSFVGDLSPEFLQSIDPDIIVEYFENASPEDLQTILANSSILLSLPSATIGSLLGKLNQDLLIQLLQSQAVADLYLNTTENLNQTQREGLVQWQKDVAVHIINNVSPDVLVQLPEDIVRLQLDNTEALHALLNHTHKLQALVIKYGAVLNDLNPDTVLELLQRDPMVLVKIPTPIFVTLSSCKVVRKLSKEFTADDLISNHTDKFIAMIFNDPNIIDCIADVNLREFVLKTFDDASYLDLQQCQLPKDCDSVVSQLIESVTVLSDETILRIAEIENILIELPDLLVIEIIAKRPELISQLSKKTVIDLAKNKPWLVGEFSLVALMRLMQRDDVLMSLTDGDLSNLLAFQPGILSVLTSLPMDKLVMFLAVHIDLLDAIPQSSVDGIKRILQDKELVRAIPTELHAKMAKKSLIIKLMDEFTLLDILEEHPYVITRLTAGELKPYLRFLHGVWFRDRLPCATVRVAALDPQFLDKLPTDLLSKVITSRHIISCIERQELEKIIQSSNLGARLSFSTLMYTARNLRLSQISLRMAISFLTKQVSRSTPRLFFN